MMVGGCSDSGNRSGMNSGSSSSAAAAAAEGSGGDLGQDWDASASMADLAAASADADGYWTVLLKTFPGAGTEAAATNMIRNAGAIDARLGRAHVHTNRSGSMVIYGRFDGVEDAAAQRALAEIKAITLEDQAVFPRAMLTRISTPRDPSTLREHDLLSVRLRYPQFKGALYTLQVGVWVADERELRVDWDEARSRAEREVLSLRGQGLPAYVHHDHDKRMSMITIGVFDRTAWDQGANMPVDPDLIRLLRRFTEHKFNGEIIEEYIVPGREDQGTRIQPPKLVLVPELT